ncbi:MAG: ABC transporter substrate-binding protein [Cyanophyceae cyanobacterium]
MKHRQQSGHLPKLLPRPMPALALCALLVGLLLSACTPQPATLSFVVSQREADYWQPLIEEFEDKHPHIRIALLNADNSILDKPDGTDELKRFLVAAFEKNSPYDLISLDIIWVPEFAESGWLMDLTDEFDKEQLEEEFLVSEVENGFYRHRLYRLPFRTDVGVLYYRQDLLQEAGLEPPDTFEELIQISQTLQKQIRWGYLWQGQTEALIAMFVEILKGYGGFWINSQTGAVGLDRPEAIQAVEFLRQTIEAGISPQGITTYEEEETRRLFRDGHAAFMRNWPNVWVDANRPGTSVYGKIAIQPMVHASGEESSVCKGGWGLGIAKATKHPQAALQAIKFFTSAAAQQQFTLAYGSVPSRRQLFFEPKIVAKYSHYPQLLNMIDRYWVARPRIPQYAQASCLLQKHLRQALNPDEQGDPSPQQAMQDAARETRHLLTQGTSDCELTTME